jgi:hypothetical protein
MALIKGKNFRIQFGNKKVFHATECTLSITTKTDEIATKDTDGDVVTTSGYNYTLSVNALMTVLPSGETTSVTIDDLIDDQLVGESLSWAFGNPEIGSKIRSGTAFVSQSDITASTEGYATGSLSFTGSGNITTTVVED